MFILLDKKWAIPASLVDDITQVEVIGSTYDPQGYKALPSLDSGDMTCVSDSELLGAEDAKEKVEELAVAELPKVKEKLEKAQLDLAREKTVARIVAEKRGLSRSDCERWAKSQAYCFYMDGKTSSDVRAWLKQNPKKEG